MYQYEVAKQKGGKNYFCYEVGEQLPIKGTFGDKKKVRLCHYVVLDFKISRTII